MNVLLVEQGTTIGPTAGGETLRYHPILDKLFGERFLDKLHKFRTWDTRIFSPYTKKLYIHHEKPGVNAFEWKDLMHAYNDLLQQTHVKLKLNTTVIKLIQDESGVVKGIECNSGEKYYGTTIVDASGVVSNLLAQFTAHYPNIGYPIVKSLVTNYTDSFQGFSSFFLTQGMLEDFPDFPPLTIFVFPHMNGRAEIGMMIFDDFCPNRNSNRNQNPDPDHNLDNEEIMRVWHHLKANYPIFSEMLVGTELEVEFVTKIGSKQLVKEPMIVPGYLILGAAGGFLEATHAAGLLSGMRSADYWTQYLKNAQIGIWNKELMHTANQTFQKTSLYKEILSSHKKIQKSKWLMYGKLKTAKRFNWIWPIFVFGKKKMG
jgi:flavin-dependent dehydrogenase